MPVSQSAAEPRCPPDDSALVLGRSPRNTDPGRTTIGVDLIETSSGPSGHALDLVRVLPGSSADEVSLGHVEADWTRLDGTTARGRVVVVR
jgi:hypothetical protein